MNKSIVLAIAGFGGLVLIGIMLSKTPSQEMPEQVEEVVEVSIPSDMPEFPLYPGAVLNNVRESSSDSSRDVSVSLSAEAEMNVIHEWYRIALSSNGWNIKSDKNVAGYQIIQGEKENLYTSLQTANGSAPGFVTISQHLKVRKK